MIYQLAGSAVAVALLVALAAWARIARPTPPLDEALARRLLAEEFPHRAVERLWIAADSAAVLARSGERALILRRTGDGYVARDVAWGDLAAAKRKDGQVSVDLRDITEARLRFAWPADAAWPPETAA